MRRVPSQANLDAATASKVDGEKLGSLMRYNMISGAGTHMI